MTREQFADFVDRLIEEVGWTWRTSDPDGPRRLICSAMERMLIEPLEGFGLVSAEWMAEKISFGEWKKLVAFSLTDFGNRILEDLGRSGHA